MRPVALWLPYQVDDLTAAEEFYTVRLGLSAVDRFDGGVVLRASRGTFVELATPGSSAPAPLAFELAGTDSVDAEFARLRPDSQELLRPPARYPRGHYGFELRGPAGATVMIWSEP